MDNTKCQLCQRVRDDHHDLVGAKDYCPGFTPKTTKKTIKVPSSAYESLESAVWQRENMLRSFPRHSCAMCEAATGCEAIQVLLWLVDAPTATHYYGQVPPAGYKYVN